MKECSCFLLLRMGNYFTVTVIIVDVQCFLSFSSTIFVLLQFGVFCFTHLYIHTTVFFFLFLFFISGDRLHTSPITSNSHIF